MAANRATAITALETYAGLDTQSATDLVEAVVEAAEREALELMAGDAPVPSSLVDARALRLRYITEGAKRALKPREVEVILRAAPSTALSAWRRMNATYPRTADQYLKKVVADTANIRKTGDQKKGYRYEISFDEPTALEYAYQLLQRKGLTHDVRVRRAEQILDLPRRIGEQDPLPVLGLKAP
ncbi:MAG TPA: hypothetical protein VE596_03575 [Gaiellaceae bacterium]|jgi:hypothetical protein|nr:hypothetical protein [Gaiellaceae bacterium]